MITWLTLEEAAKHLKIGKSTIYRLAREGDLPAHRMGRVWRFDVKELDAWMKQSPDMSQSGIVKASTGENQDG
jgi:excisionase family DNA binding protein